MRRTIVKAFGLYVFSLMGRATQRNRMLRLNMYVSLEAGVPTHPFGEPLPRVAEDGDAST